MGEEPLTNTCFYSYSSDCTQQRRSILENFLSQDTMKHILINANFDTSSFTIAIKVKYSINYPTHAKNTFFHVL